MTTAIVTSSVVELSAPKRLHFRQEPLDVDGLSPCHIAAKTLFSAISPGTELAAWAGDPPLRPGNVYPRLVGYCNVAEVIGVGSQVKEFSIGDHILSMQSHRSAFICHEDEITLKLPTKTDLIAACTTYLFHLGYNALLKGCFKPGHHVGIVGLGTLGLGAVAVSTSVGAVVMAISNQPESRQLAGRFGAAGVFEKNHDASGNDIAVQTQGTGLDIVIVTSNAWSDWKLALQLARKGGTICVIGFPGRNNPIPPFNPLDSQYFYDKQLQLIACGQSPKQDLLPELFRFTVKRNCVYLLGLIHNQKLPARDLVASVHPRGEIEAVYQRMEQREFGPRTCVLDWN